MVRGATPALTTALSGQTLQMGAIQPIEWYGPSNSFLVDLDLYEKSGVLSRSIVKNLPDFGSFTWFVPEMWSTTSTIRATFKDAAGVALSATDSGTFRVQYAITPGTLITRYRLYSPVTLEHLFTTDPNEYSVLGQTGIWVPEGAASHIHNGPTNIGGVEAVPYYRVYDFQSRWHLWTTDRNDAFGS